MASSKGSCKGKLTFVDLPLETQKTVFNYVNRKDLHGLLLVSKHFFDLASTEIYRDLEFKCTTSDALDYGAMSSRLGDALQTIVASDHDYAQYIKSFRYGISEANAHNALIMGRILWDASADPCKILNTTLLLMLKKAVILEKFQWDMPVELSGAVYKALHKIQSLRHLRIRLDVQASAAALLRQSSLPMSHPSNIALPPTNAAPPYTFPAPISHSNHSQSKLLNPSLTNPMQYNYWSNNRAFSNFRHLVSLKLLGISDLDCLTEIAGCLKSSAATLKSLTLSISQDLALKSCKPSVPNPMVDELSESDPDNDEDTWDAPPQPTITMKKGFNDADIRKEKIAQEAILSRIFDLQGVALEGKKLEKSISQIAKSDLLEDPSLFIPDVKAMMKELIGYYKNLSGSDNNERRREFLEMTMKAAEKCLNAHQTKAKQPIKEASKSASQRHKHPAMPSESVPPMYHIADPGIPGSGPAISSSQWFLGGTLPSTSSMTPGGGHSEAVKSFNPESLSHIDSYTPPYNPGPIGSLPMSPLDSSLYPPIYNKFSFSTKGAHHGSHDKNNLSDLLSNPSSFPPMNLPTEIAKKIKQTLDGTLPEGEENTDPFLAMNDVGLNEESENAEPLSASNTPIVFPASESLVETQDDSMDVDMEHPDEDTIEASADQEMNNETEEVSISPRKRARFDIVGHATYEPADVQDRLANQSSAEEDRDHSHSTDKSPDEAMQDYVRETHGLQIEEFSLYLIPLKGSIVARGLDLNVLKRLTLLNVGSQHGFWLLLTRLQNRSIQVSLESIHTDDVSLAFLDFLETFRGLAELFMHERSTKHEIDTTIIARTGVDITEIRKKGLRKHMKTLKRLMLKNDNDDAWDLDPRSILLLSHRGSGLRELAVSMSMENYHIFMQNVSSFKSLVALHFLVLRESGRTLLYPDALHSAVDSFSHYPGAKIKWIALNNDLRLVSHKSNHWIKMFKKRKEERKKKAQLKSKGKGKARATDEGETEESSGADTLGDEANNRLSAMRLRADIRSGMGDVKDTKIFNREIRFGKL